MGFTAHGEVEYLTTGAQRSGRWEHCCDVLTLWSNITVVEGRLWQC